MENTIKRIVAGFAMSAIIASMFVVFTITAAGQEVSVSKPAEAESNQVKSKPDVFPVSDPGLKRGTPPAATSPTSNATSPASPQAGDDKWLIEIRPYVWAAGLYGRFRVRNTTADTGKSSTSILGMLDFAAAFQLEAKKKRWTFMFDENYVNLGTTATGPLGITSIKVEPTTNLFEFGASYEFVATPAFSAEVLGGGRYVHLGVGLQPENAPAVEGSRNLIGVFVGNRFKAQPHKGVSLIGKYTVGTSGVGSQFAWSADLLVDLRLKKGFSIGGGYRWLGLNADDANNAVGFDGQMRGLILTATIYR